MFNRFKRAPAPGKEAQFWQWFVTNEQQIYSLERNQQEVLNLIAAQIQRVNPDLVFAIGMVQEDGRREFVISAGGLRSVIPAVEALHASAPNLPRWIWVKYRPRTDGSSGIQFGGETVRAEDVRYLILPQGEYAGICLFIKGYDASRKSVFDQIGFLLLDNVLGEYAVMTQAGSIEFEGQESQYINQSRPLSELAAQFDSYFGKK